MKKIPEKIPENVSKKFGTGEEHIWHRQNFFKLVPSWCFKN